MIIIIMIANSCITIVINSSSSSSNDNCSSNSSSNSSSNIVGRTLEAPIPKMSGLVRKNGLFSKAFIFPPVIITLARPPKRETDFPNRPIDARYDKNSYCKNSCCKNSYCKNSYCKNSFVRIAIVRTAIFQNSQNAKRETQYDLHVAKTAKPSSIKLF